MKKFVYIFILSIFISLSCQSINEKQTEKLIEINKEDVFEELSSTQIEKYPNGQTKTIGEVNEEGERNGLWVSYFENGTKWSETNFLNGKRNGHSIVFYPNGRVWYFGDYSNDKKSGEWVFYNEEGEITKKESF